MENLLVFLKHRAKVAKKKMDSISYVNVRILNDKVNNF